LEKAKAAMDKNSHHQSACITASLALAKSILREMYQKQMMVTAIFNNNFRIRVACEFFFTTASSISFLDRERLDKFMRRVHQNRVQVKSK
jgi:hypothetical protein